MDLIPELELGNEGARRVNRMFRAGSGCAPIKRGKSPLKSDGLNIDISPAHPYF